MNDFLFSLNATMPIFFLMILGFTLKYLHFLNKENIRFLNLFVFHISLPILLFEDIASSHFIELWDTRFILISFLITLLSIGLCIILAFVCHVKYKAEFIQGSYRSSAALLGISYLMNIYGNAKIAPLMIISCVPLYNISAVIILSFGQNRSIDKKMLKQTCFQILKNPIILGIVLGVIVSLFHIPVPKMIYTFLASVSHTASPLGLIGMGASLSLSDLKHIDKEAIGASFMKLIGLSLVFIPLAIVIGFKGEKLVAISIMLSSATTVTSYVMARVMGYQGKVSSLIVLYTTLFSSVTITFIIYILKLSQLI